jgi:putative ABC transport system ATP-binding protein
VELLRRLHRDGQTIVLVTHNPEVAAAAGRVVRMRDGRIADPAGIDIANPMGSDTADLAGSDTAAQAGPV